MTLGYSIGSSPASLRRTPLWLKVLGLLILAIGALCGRRAYWAYVDPGTYDIVVRIHGAAVIGKGYWFHTAAREINLFAALFCIVLAYGFFMPRRWVRPLALTACCWGARISGRMAPWTPMDK